MPARGSEAACRLLAAEKPGPAPAAAVRRAGLILRLLRACLRLLWLLALRLLRPKTRASSTRPPCVLVSGGGSVQAVQLARQLKRAGARVVVCEMEDRLALARFSRSCARFYALPRPRAGAAAEYVRALADLVRREGVTTYLPLAASSAAYFDALAKPHLERLSCECLVPGAAQVARLDDPLELLRVAREKGLPIPRHWLFLDNLAAVERLYETGRLQGPRLLAMPAGPAGMRERGPGITLPPTLAEFNGRLQTMTTTMIAGPWLVLAEPAGPQYVVCATLKDSRLLASATCRVDKLHGSLVPEDRPEVRRWLERFLDNWPELSGHLSFRLAAKPGAGPLELVALSCRVGLGLAYLGHSALQANLLARCCIQDREHEATTILNVPGAGVYHGRTIDEREALFQYWDPLPYLVYRYLQLPMRRVVGALGRQRGQHQPPLAVVQ